jgi:hypothetical protein
MNMRMARMNVYLPDELHEQVKSLELPVSDILQHALRAEIRRRELVAEADALIKRRDTIVGPPTAEERARVRGIVQRLGRRGARKAS